VLDELGIGGIDSVPDAPVRGKEAVAETHEERKRKSHSIFSRLISAAEALAAGGGLSASDPAMSELEERLNNLKRN
jgi:hypothetical protein